MEKLWEILAEKLPKALLTWAGVFVCLAFVALVIATLDSVYRTKEPLLIAGYPFGHRADVSLPGVVFAFYTDCPEGWAQYPKAIGRVVVGAGDPKLGDTGLDEAGKPLLARSLGQVGGFVPEPNLPITEASDIVHGNRFVVSGGPNPQALTKIQTMPPYLPLNYCWQKPK